MSYTHEQVADYLANSKSPVQLVKHWDEVPDAKKLYPIIGQQKHDGVYCLAVVINGTVALYGRTGMRLFYQALGNVCDQLDNVGSGVYIAEYCNPVLSLEQLSGYLNPNRKKEYTDDEWYTLSSSCLYFHDYITIDELLAGESKRPYIERHAYLEHLLDHSKYVVGYELLNDEDDVTQYAEAMIEQGHEGVVFKKADAGWLAGHKGFHAMKIVKGVNLDLKCVGVVYGRGKREGQIAALELEYKGNKFKADLGKGWTDERRKALTLAHGSGVDTTVFPVKGYGSTEVPPVGKVWEVKALDISSTGKALRLPKVVRVRWDKEEPDA